MPYSKRNFVGGKNTKTQKHDNPPRRTSMGHYWVAYKQMKVTADELHHLSGSQTHELSVLMLPKRVLVFPLAVLEPPRLNRKIPTTGSQRG